MKPGIKYAALTASIALSGGLVFYAVSQWLVVTDIQVEIKTSSVWNQVADKIQNRLEKKFQPFIGKKVKEVSLKELIQIALAESQVRDARALRLWPSQFLIQAQLRKPQLVLLDAQGQIRPLSMNGDILPPVKSNHIPNLPILRGEKFARQKSLRQLALAFIQQLPSEGALSQQSISEILYSSSDNSLYFILSKNGKKITVGNNPQKMKIKRIESVLHYLQQQNIKWRVIDARFSKKIVVSTSQDI